MKKTLKHLLPALFLAAVMALLTGCTKSVDLLQYADVTFDGASGNATATVTLDYNGLGKELFGKSKDQDIWDEAQTELSLMGHVNYTVTPQTGLSNGDTVTLAVSADDTFLKNHEISLSETSKTLTVSGLKEPCLLYTSDAADERSSVDLGGRRIFKKKKKETINTIKNSNKG